MNRQDLYSIIENLEFIQASVRCIRSIVDAELAIIPQGPEEITKHIQIAKRLVDNQKVSEKSRNFLNGIVNFYEATGQLSKTQTEALKLTVNSWAHVLV